LYREIVEKVIELLKSDPELSEPTKVKRYYFGFPVRVDVYPFISVRWTGGPITVQTTKKRRYEINLEIFVADQSTVEDLAEKSVMNLTEKIDEVLSQNPTLDGLVDESYLTNIESESTVKGSYTIVGVRITLTAFKIKT